MMKRRSFLGAMLGALTVAPTIVRATSLMPIAVNQTHGAIPGRGWIMTEEYGGCAFNPQTVKLLDMEIGRLEGFHFVEDQARQDVGTQMAQELIRQYQGESIGRKYLRLREERQWRQWRSGGQEFRHPQHLPFVNPQRT